MSDPMPEPPVFDEDADLDDVEPAGPFPTEAPEGM